jgi:hypothetical protein
MSPYKNLHTSAKQTFLPRPILGSRWILYACNGLQWQKCAQVQDYAYRHFMATEEEAKPSRDSARRARIERAEGSKEA